MPDDFTRFLRINTQSTGAFLSEFTVFVSKKKYLYSLIERSFSDVDAKGRVDVIMKSLGWDILRNRLAVLFIEKKLKGHFPTNATDTRSIAEILAFEDKVSPYTVSGHSRSFLLAFYLKLALLHLREVDPQTKRDDLIIRDETIALLKFSHAKVINIDWLLLLLVHLEKFIGHKELSALLKKGVDYDEIIGYLKPKEKDQMTSNFLAYGSSINDLDMFSKITN